MEKRALSTAWVILCASTLMLFVAGGQMARVFQALGLWLPSRMIQ